jgi:hypothetical protein
VLFLFRKPGKNLYLLELRNKCCRKKLDEEICNLKTEMKILPPPPLLHSGFGIMGYFLVFGIMGIWRFGVAPKKSMCKLEVWFNQRSTECVQNKFLGFLLLKRDN